MEMPIATQYVLYTNDGMEVSYSDGSRLVISPCGASFQYHRAVSDVHPAFRNTRAENRSQFATQDVRPCLIDALDFRNRFTECPFLCKELIDPRQIVRLHANIQEIAWPSTVTDGDLHILKDRSVRLVSEDEYAVIIVGSNRRHVTVEYLAKVSHRASRRSLEISRQKDTTHMNTTSIDNSVNTGDSKWDYVWTVQYFSVQNCPEYWKEPLDSVMHCLKNMKENSLSTSASKTVEFHDPQFTDNSKIDASTGFVDSGQQFERSSSEKVGNRKATSSSLQAENEASPFKFQSRVSKSSQSYDSTPVSSRNAKDHTLRSSEIDQKEVEALLELRNVTEYSLSSPAQQQQQGPSVKNLLKKDFEGCIFSTVPKTLPLNCSAQHLHKWEDKSLPSNGQTMEAAYVQGQVKVICVQGVIYRLLWSGARGIEIYPGDGSVIVSQNLTGKFFTHFIPKNGKVVDRIYSSESLPPKSPNFPYSVNKLVTRAVRFLQLLQAENFQLVSQTESICWKQNDKKFIHSPRQIPSTRILEENVVGGVGTFVAYTNGQIHIKFLDRTILDMAFDYYDKVTAHESIHSKLLSLQKTLNIREGMCRLLLPSGHYQYVSIDDPGVYDKYIRAAVSWRDWVTTDPNERQKEIDEKQDKSRRVFQELKKIQCFNFLLENSLLARFSPLIAATTKLGQPESEAGCSVTRGNDLDNDKQEMNNLRLKLMNSVSLEQNDSCVSQDVINEILRKTSAAVEDIGTFLKSNGETKPVRG